MYGGVAKPVYASARSRYSSHMNLIRPLLILITSLALSGCGGDGEPIQVNNWRIDTGLNLIQPIKVLHISDIHYQEDTGPAVMAELAEIAGATKPDIIALTGDYTGEDLPTTERIRPAIIDGLERLSEGRRAYVTLGNHELTQALIAGYGASLIALCALSRGSQRSSIYGA